MAGDGPYKSRSWAKLLLFITTFPLINNMMSAFASKKVFLKAAFQHLGDVMVAGR